MFRKGILSGSYGLESTNEIAEAIRRHMREWVEGGHVLVVGSESPWIEAILVEMGAANVTTIDYNEISSRVDNVRVVSPEDVRRMWRDTRGQGWDSPK
jgi:hypothetical protein